MTAHEPGGWQPAEYVTEVEPPEKLRELQALHSLALPDPEPDVYEKWAASHPDACPCNEPEADDAGWAGPGFSTPYTEREPEAG